MGNRTKTSILLWFPLAALTTTLLCAGAASDRHPKTSGATRRVRVPRDAGVVVQAANDAGHRVPVEDFGTRIPEAGVSHKPEDGGFESTRDAGPIFRVAARALVIVKVNFINCVIKVKRELRTSPGPGRR